MNEYSLAKVQLFSLTLQSYTIKNGNFLVLLQGLLGFSANPVRF